MQLGRRVITKHSKTLFYCLHQSGGQYGETVEVGPYVCRKKGPFCLSRVWTPFGGLKV